MKFVLNIAHYSNDSWYDVGDYYKGVYELNTSVSVDIPGTPDVYYILNFNHIARSYGTYDKFMLFLIT